VSGVSGVSGFGSGAGTVAGVVAGAVAGVSGLPGGVVAAPADALTSTMGAHAILAGAPSAA
jgi:hypothetical protein